MKRFKVIILMSVIVVSWVVLSWNLTSKLFNNTKMLAQDEIIEIFKSNKESFINASDDLIGYQYHWSIRKKKHSNWKDVVLKNGVHLIIHEEEHFDEISFIQEIVESNRHIEEILKYLEFKIITNNAMVDKDSIYFIKQTAIGFASGIIYCPSGKPQNPYITKLIQIEPSWFYFEEK